MNKLSVKGMVLGLGFCWGIGMLLLGWIAVFSWGERIVEVLSSLYIGFRPGFLGGIIGAIWGLVDGAIGGAIIAFIYNAVVRKKVLTGTAIAKNIGLSSAKKPSLQPPKNLLL